MRGARGWARRGITVIEYLVLIVLVAIVLIGAARVLGWRIAEKFGGGSAEIDAIQEDARRRDGDLYGPNKGGDNDERGNTDLESDYQGGDRVVATGTTRAGGGRDRGGVSAAPDRGFDESSRRGGVSFELAGEQERRGRARDSALTKQGPGSRGGGARRKGSGSSLPAGRLKNAGLGTGEGGPRGDRFHPATLGAALLILIVLGALVIVRRKKGGASKKRRS